jgi:DNA-binding FadR family transcriptional regulator
LPLSQQPVNLRRHRVADQIVEDLRTQILSGELADGSKLPSEKDLAAHYDVSGPTIREAVRVLTAMGLLDLRNGARATVTARTGPLLAMSLASVVQFEKMDARDVLGLLGVLQAYAAELATKAASDAEIARFRAAGELTMTASGPAAGAALKAYFGTLAEISHNPLLTALCTCITDFHLGLAGEVLGPRSEGWGKISGTVADTRMLIVEAIEDRNAERAARLVRAYHQRVIELIQELPEAERLRADDPGLSAALSRWLSANVGLAPLQ